MAASDCNRDGIPATVADLIYLLAVINGTIPSPRALPEAGTAQVDLIDNGFDARIDLKSNMAIGGALLQIKHDNTPIDNIIAPAGATLKYSNHDGVLTLLVYAESNQVNLAGQSINLKFGSGNHENIQIQTQEISDNYGRLMK